jgi:N-acetylglucosaminyldiphosphoundecaprenol N-acetyl-beta-D-mannosaminyltransferase
MKKVNIMGVNISVIKKAEVLKIIGQFLISDTQHFITTPNPEIILEASHHEELFYILNKSDLAVLDGFGLKIACWLSGANIERYPGADLAVYPRLMRSNKRS